MKKIQGLFRLCAVVLAICIGFTGVATNQAIKVYASEDSGDGDDILDGFDLDGESELTPEQSSIPETKPESEPEPDPFDYNLASYTPSINFGTYDYGDIIYAKQFSIVNVGVNRFPLTYDEMDPYTAFDIGRISDDEYMDPNESILYSVSPREDLEPGTYQARYTFYSANDIRRHHTTTVDVSVTIVKGRPYVFEVEVIPGAATIPVGKSYDFDVYVSGINDYDMSVTWSLTGNQSAGTTVDADGRVSVGVNETASTFVVVATSRQDPSKIGRGIVTVTSVDHVVSVKADPAEGGAVAGGGAVRNGGSCSISASPNNNYMFMGWYENDNYISGSGQTTLDNITSDRNLVARFKRQTCYIRTGVNVADGGSITGSQSVVYGGKVTITARANNGYSFGGFVEDNRVISTASSIELNNITSDRYIVAVFNRDTCSVNASVSPSDTGKVEGAGTYNKGSKVELKTRAYDGYEFVGWSVNGQIVSRDDRYVINSINSDVNLVANFMKKNATTYKIVSGITNAGGAITPSGDYVVAEGGSVTYNIMAQNGYKIASVIIDGKNIGAVSSYTFNNVRGGHTITVGFDKLPEEPVKKATTSTAPKEAAKSDNTSNTGAKGDNSKKKTDYNNTTAIEGALPEQTIITEVPKEAEALEEEQYAEDVYIESAESEPVKEEYTVKNVMARHDLDEQTLRILISDDAVLPMLREAFEDGTLRITVNNSYAADKQETAVQLYHSQPSLLNFEDVIAETLTEEEKFAVLTGTPVSFNIDITENTDTVDENTKRMMQTKVGYRPVSYFDFLILKTSGGITSVIDTTSAELEVVVPIPEQYRKEGRRFYIIRNHNGVVDILEDIGNDPTTITFKTDRFSEYAIAYEAINVNKLVLRVVIIAITSLLLAVICSVNLIKYKRRARKH
jgi:hypothetical protein